MRKGLIFAVFAMLFIPGVLGLDQVIVNSESWQDVYSGMLFASLSNVKGKYLLNEQDAFEKIRLVDEDFPDTLLVESDAKPVMAGYGTSLAQQGLIVEKVISFHGDANIKLARRLATNRFIIVDDSYGYNAISVAPYAVLSHRFVIFANSDTIEQVGDFLRDVSNPDIMVFGHIAAEAQEVLAPYNPQTIDEQDRFLNNVAIGQKFLEDSNNSQVTFSNGEFLEPSLFFGEFPTVFIGKERTPQAVKDFLVHNGIHSGVLVGNDLIPVMRDLREELNISVFIRFSQGRFNQVRQLDLFPVPVSTLSMTITNVFYDPTENTLIVTYKNTGPTFLYFRSSISLSEGEELLRRTGDDDAIFLETGEIKSISYDLGDMRAVEGIITAQISTLYGSSPLIQELLLSQVFSVEPGEFRDDSSLRIVSLVYDEEELAFFVEVENTGSIDTYVHLELQDVSVAGATVTLTVSGETLVRQGEIRTIKVPVTLRDEDYLKNSQVAVSARFGKARELLIHEVKENLSLQVKYKENTQIYVYGLYALSTLVGILLLAVVLLAVGRKKPKKKRRKEED